MLRQLPTTGNADDPRRRELFKRIWTPPKDSRWLVAETGKQVQSDHNISRLKKRCALFITDAAGGVTLDRRL